MAVFCPIAENRLDNLKRWRIQEDLASLCGRDVDLLDMGQASLVMQFEVISSGERIYCAAENTIAHYENLVYSRYLDFNQVRKEIVDGIIKNNLSDFQEFSKIALRSQK